MPVKRFIFLLSIFLNKENKLQMTETIASVGSHSNKVYHRVKTQWLFLVILYLEATPVPPFSAPPFFKAQLIGCLFHKALCDSMLLEFIESSVLLTTTLPFLLCASHVSRWVFGDLFT